MIFDGYFIDIGVPEDLARARRELALKKNVIGRCGAKPAAEIENFPNSELRRIMIEPLPRGGRDAGHRCLAARYRWRPPRPRRNLWHAVAPHCSGGEPFLAVEVATTQRNPTARTSTTFCGSIPKLRPILSDGQFGAPQPLIARNAVASSFGLCGVDYEPDVETWCPGGARFQSALTNKMR